MGETPSQPGNPHGLEQRWQNLRVDMSKLRSDLAEVAQALFDAGKAEADDARERLQAVAQERLDKVRHTLDDARERGQGTADTIKQKVEEQPLTSVLVAFGAGMLLGSLMKRR
jgi:ElaB/YqjD/DUF883 family membrane-anchored ribosome-binding protein